MRISLLLVLLLADPKAPPTCDAKSKGLAWNFGSYETPNIRLCDGISFVPLQPTPPAAATPIAVSSPAAAAPDAGTKLDCEKLCVATFRTCVNGGAVYFKGDCRAADQTCMTRCGLKFDP